MKTYKFWAKIKGSRNPFVITEIKAKNKKSAKKWLIDNNYDVE